MAKQQGTWEASGFSLPAFRMPVKLWSSQAPTQRGPSGGFGALTEGGYGVSYLINEDNMYLHVCYRYSPDPDPDPDPDPVPCTRPDATHTATERGAGDGCPALLSC